MDDHFAWLSNKGKLFDTNNIKLLNSATKVKKNIYELQLAAQS